MSRKKESLDYEALLEAIIKIDMFRDIKVTMFDRLENLLIRSGVKNIKEILRDLKTTIDRILGAVSKNKQFMKYSKWAARLKVIATTVIVVMVGLLFATLIFRNPIYASIALWYPSLLLSIVILPNAYLIADYYARTELKLMKARKSGRISQLDRNLRDINQKLINALVIAATRDKKRPKDLRFKVWHLDYDKVRVAKKPWLLGKYWVVEPDIPEPEI